MKSIFFLSIAALSSTAAVAQNSAVINQQGGPHEVSIVQRGSGNTSVISQSNDRSANQVSVVQSGSGNVATINQGNRNDSTENSQNSVTTTQSGEGETMINQTKDGNSISVYQSSDKTISEKKKPASKKNKR